MARPRKNVVSEENVLSNTDSLTLTLDTPTDIPEEAEKSLLEKAKDFLKMDSKEEEKEEKVTTRGRKKKVESPTFTFQQYSTMVSLGVISWLSYVTDEKYQKLLPNQEQANSILLPWCRILDRHTKITQVNPDVSDVMVSFAAIVAYGFEARSIYILIKEEEEKKKEDVKKEAHFPFTIRDIENITK